MAKELKVTKATIIRTLVLFLTIANLILSSTGHDVLPFTDEGIENFVNVGAVTIASIVSWWYNNSFTKPAIKADNAMKAEKKLYSKK